MSHRRILITGACGFTGRHLAAQLTGVPGVTQIGLDVGQDPPVALDRYLCCDLTDAAAVQAAVDEARPDVVFHLAGLFGSAPPEQIRAVNVEGFVHLRDALGRFGHNRSAPISMVTVGSAAELGRHGAANLPVEEDAPCRPESAYGRSKLEVTRLALAEPHQGPLAIVVARPFNLVGPGLSTRLSLGAFAAQIRAVVAGEADAVRCGNLEARRDFVDVRDAVRAYLALAERGRPGELYNVCAGRSYRLGDLLESLIALSVQPVPVVVDRSRFRTRDLPDVYGSTAKIRGQTGWTPRVPILQSLADLLASPAVTPSASPDVPRRAG